MDSLLGPVRDATSIGHGKLNPPSNHRYSFPRGRQVILGHEDLVWRGCALSSMSKDGAWRGSLWSDVGIRPHRKGLVNCL